MSQLERKIKDKLLDHKIEFDTDELWSQVYPQIKPERNRKPILFLLFGALFIVGGAIGWQLLSVDHLENAELSQLTISNSAKNDEPKSTPIKSTQTNIPAQSKALEKIKPIYNSDKIQDKIFAETESNKPTEINNSRQLIIQSQSQPLTIDRNSILSESKASSGFTSFESRNFTTNDEIVTYVTSGNSETTSAIESKNKQSPLLAFGTEDEEVAYKIPYLSQSLMPINFEDTYPVMTLGYAEDFEPSAEAKLSIYGLASFFAIDKKLSSSGAEPSSDLARRRDSESALESIAGEIGFSYHLTDRIILSSGLNYIRINEKVSADYSTTDIVDLENVVIENIISPNGMESVYGDVKAERTTTTQLRAYNRYSDLSLSLDLTYLFVTGKWTPYASVGIQQSLSSMQRGYWLLENNTLYDIETDENSFIKSPYGLGVRLSLGGSFSLSDRTSLILSARHIRYASSITSDLYSIQQKYSLLGINAGLSLKL